MSDGKLWILVAGFLLQAPELLAQVERVSDPRVHAGVSFLVGHPVGEFQKVAGPGLGVDFFGRYRLDTRGVLSLRADLAFLVYGYDSEPSCQGAAWCSLLPRDVITHDIGMVGIGPEIALPSKTTRPYVHGFLGYSYFSTSTDYAYPWEMGTENQVEIFGDGALCWGAEGGMELRLGRGSSLVALNLGVRYRDNGRVKTLPERDLADTPEGSATLHPVLGQANFLTYHLGVSIGIPALSGSGHGTIPDAASPSPAEARLRSMRPGSQD